MGNNAVAWSQNLSNDDGELINVNYPIATHEQQNSKQVSSAHIYASIQHNVAIYYKYSQY